MKEAPTAASSAQMTLSRKHCGWFSRFKRKVMLYSARLNLWISCLRLPERSVIQWLKRAFLRFFCFGIVWVLCSEQGSCASSKVASEAKDSKDSGSS
jgi:hypothetical protein